MIGKDNYYVAGIFDGEGCCSDNSISITNTDLHLLETTSKCLSDIGIKNKIRERKKYEEHFKNAYDLRIYGRKNIDNFYTYIPFQSREKRHKMLNLLVKSRSVIDKKVFKKIENDKLAGMSYRKLAKKFNHPHTTIFNYVSKKVTPTIKYKNIAIVIFPTPYSDYDIIGFGYYPLLRKLSHKVEHSNLIKLSKFGGISILILDTCDTLRDAISCIKCFKKEYKDYLTNPTRSCKNG